MGPAYDLYDGMPPHVAQQTSLEAAQAIESDVSQLRETVFRYVKGEHLQGATCDEVEVELNMRHQTASARLRELVLTKRVVDSGMRRRTRSGRWAIVWGAKWLEGGPNAERP